MTKRSMIDKVKYITKIYARVAVGWDSFNSIFDGKMVVGIGVGAAKWLLIT